jgi:hypothetical protein
MRLPVFIDPQFVIGHDGWMEMEGEFHDWILERSPKLVLAESSHCTQWAVRYVHGPGICVPSYTPSCQRPGEHRQRCG